MPKLTPADLRRRARELLELADRMEADERRAAELTGGAPAPTMVTMDTTANETQPSSRPGVKLTASGPYAIAAIHAGMSLRGLGDKLGLKYSAIKMRNQKGIGDAAIKAKLAKPPYSVPASAWPDE